jgi:RNA recognition motif-containing protein
MATTDVQDRMASLWTQTVGAVTEDVLMKETKRREEMELETAPQDSNDSSSEAGRAIYIGNLSWATTDTELKEYLATAGTCESCQVQTHPDTGRSKGWALARYSSAAEARFAISQLNQQVFQGRALKVMLDREEVNSRSAAKIYVGGFAWETTDKQLQELTAPYQPIDIRIERYASGKSRGFAIVSFDSADNAQIALQCLDGFNFNGRTLEVREDRGPTVRENRAARTSDKTCLYVSNVSFDTTDESLMKLFSSAGAKPTSASVQKNKRNISKGWALVQYATAEEAEQTRLQLDNADVDGRAIKVRYDSRQ